jgi:hypothetical protein
MATSSSKAAGMAAAEVRLCMLHVLTAAGF